jgi:replicative DNA helicase
MNLSEQIQNSIKKVYNWEITTVSDIDWLDINEYTRWIDWMPNWLWKFNKRDLVVLAWYPSCWKTEFTYFIAKENAKIWIKTLYISLELKPEDMFIRIARKKAWVSKLDWQERKLTNEQFETIDLEYKKLQNIKDIQILSYEEAPKVERIIETMDKYREMWFWLFFIDNLWKIVWEQNEITRFWEITSKLQDYKNKHNICVWLLHHLSKPNKQVQYKPWWASAIRWSQKIIDNASLVFELYRNLDPDEEDKDEKKITKLILLKDTMDWATWTVNLEFNKWDYLLFNKNQNGF